MVARRLRTVALLRRFKHACRCPDPFRLWRVARLPIRRITFAVTLPLQSLDETSSSQMADGGILGDSGLGLTV